MHHEREIQSCDGMQLEKYEGRSLMLIACNARTEDSLDVKLGGGIEKHFAKHFAHKLQDNFRIVIAILGYPI